MNKNVWYSQIYPFARLEIEFYGMVEEIDSIIKAQLPNKFIVIKIWVIVKI